MIGAAAVLNNKDRSIRDFLLEHAKSTADIQLFSPFFSDHDLVRKMLDYGASITLVVRLCGLTAPSHLREIAFRDRLDILWFTAPTFHTKLYLFGTQVAVAGSANLTGAGLQTNSEACLALFGESPAATQLREFGKSISSVARPLTHDVLARYEKVFTSSRAGSRDDENFAILEFGLIGPPNNTRIDSLAQDEQDPVQRDLKSAYAAHVVTNAPALLEINGGRLKKSTARVILEGEYKRELPRNLSNAYGHAFRRLFLMGITEAATDDDYYRLRE